MAAKSSILGGFLGEELPAADAGGDDDEDAGDEDDGDMVSGGGSCLRCGGRPEYGLLCVWRASFQLSSVCGAGCRQGGAAAAAGRGSERCTGLLPLTLPYPAACR